MAQFQDWYQGALTINPSYVALYDMWHGPRSSPATLPLSNKREKYISNKSAQRIKRTINILLDSAKLKSVYNKATGKWFRFRLNLITLTLPSAQVHGDKEIHNTIFKNFIRAIKQKFPGFMYIYKAEVQDNGNLHYHLTTNTYIDYLKLRNIWNYYTEKLGYVSRSGVQSPNSTDVHAVKNIRDLAAYMVSYLTKKDIYKKNLKRYFRRFGKRLKLNDRECTVLPRGYFSSFKRLVDIKLWDCSKALQLPPLRFLEGEENYKYIVNYVLSVKSEKVYTDRCLIVKWDRSIINNDKVLKDIYGNWINLVNAPSAPL